ncbi:MAG: alpha/beta hydrolase [Anaerolineae bacterium]|nr:alpha/beta hydrolase [Anaerolineae bacterium]
MSRSTNRVRSEFLSLLLMGVGSFYVHRAFRAEKRQKLEWLRSTSQVFTTEHGSIEYAVRGQGQPLLYIHGGMGGFEQGIALAEMPALDDFQLITFSRPGYRRTDISIGGSLPEQAESACRVLDHLGIRTAAVIALSAGGMAGLQFAQNYPERCKALILLSAQGPELAHSRPSRFWLWLLDLMLASDFFVWMLMNLGMTVLTRLMRVVNVQDSLPQITQFFAGVSPASDWRVGTANDVDQLINQQSIKLERIHVPTLVLHGTQDVIVPPVVANDNAIKIPQAQLTMIDGGTHIMMATHAGEISHLIRHYLERISGQMPHN